MYDRGGGVMIYLGDSWKDYAAVLLVAGLLYSGFVIFVCKVVFPSVFTQIRRKSEKDI